MNYFVTAAWLAILAGIAGFLYWLFRKATKKTRRLTMAQCIALWIGLPSLCLALATFISNRVELGGAFQQTLCTLGCPPLSTDQLKLGVIKSYLHFMLDNRKAASDGMGYDQLVLLPVAFNAQSLAQGLEDASLLHTLTSNAILLKSHTQIEALQKDVITTHPSIAAYSLSYRSARVTPMSSFQPIRLDEIDPRYRPSEAAEEHIGRWERLRGYGQHFFKINEYDYLDLSCCDGRGDYGGTSLEQRKLKSLEHIRTNGQLVLAVSLRGDILKWEGHGESPGKTFSLIWLKN